MPTIFVSYRRDDSRDITGRVYDRLVASFPADWVFRDIDSIPAGGDFRRVIEWEVGRCDIMLVIIGPNWSQAADVRGNRRLDDPNDFVRLEIQAALRRGILVIPLLVGNAAMPAAEELPEGLHELAYRNGRAVRPDPDFHCDMDRLLQELADMPPAPGLGDPGSEPQAGREPARPGGSVQAKYYVYVSRSKVEMLYSQIPARQRHHLAIKLDVDLPRDAGPGPRPCPVDEALLAKTRLVVGFLEDQDAIGTISQPRPYFAGATGLRWGPYEMPSWGYDGPRVFRRRDGGGHPRARGLDPSRDRPCGGSPGPFPFGNAGPRECPFEGAWDRVTGDP
jgi:hypothetical protein